MVKKVSLVKRILLLIITIFITALNLSGCAVDNDVREIIMFGRIAVFETIIVLGRIIVFKTITASKRITARIWPNQEK